MFVNAFGSSLTIVACVLHTAVWVVQLSCN